MTPTTSSDRQAHYENHFDLRALFEFSKSINSSYELRFILGHLLLTIMGKLLSLRGIVLLHRKGPLFVAENVKGIPQEVIGTEISVTTIPKRTIYLSKIDLRRHPWAKILHRHGIDMVIPIMIHDRVLGMMGFAPSIKKKRLPKSEVEYITSLANIAAGAIERGLVVEELRQVNRRLDRKVQELNTLFEASKEFNVVLDKDRLIRLLLFSIMGQIGASRYFICLETDRSMNVVASRLDKPLDSEFLSLLTKITAPVRVTDLAPKTGKRLLMHLQEHGIHVLIPLYLQQQMKGVVGLGEKMRAETYSAGDLEFLSSIGNLAIISLENVRLFQEAIEKQRLEDELLIAREIQRGLLPSSLPEVPNFSLAAVNISSKQVGGDYYDVRDLGNNRFLVAIGDVSGKGTPASLLMANLQATIRALIPLDVTLSELTGRVNDLLCENTTSGRFITFFWGVLDAEHHTLRYVSAGHNPPFLLHRDGSMERLEQGGLILGVMKTLKQYDEGEVRIDEGDLLLLFTDGVSEAMNVQGEELGEELLERTLRSASAQPAESIMDAIVKRVKEHNVHTIQSDDITMIVLKALS